jgi:hypothetical protein
MIEGYGYKILFEDGSWYWGTSQYKGAPPEKDGYYGSPVTHKAKWREPHSKIVLKIFHNEQERCDYENICILPDLDNPRCLNEHAGPAFSRAVHEKSKGVPRPPGVKEKISKKNRGRKLTPEHIQKLKDAERPPITPEAIAKRVESRKGYRHSKETKQKMSETAKGRPVSPKARAKIAESVKGFKWYNNGTESAQARSHPGEGWVEGRLLDWDTPRSKGMKWYHKDGKRKMFREDPGDGWIRGRLDIPNENNPTNRGKSWYNDGKTNKMFVEPPEGWIPGRLRRANGRG